MRNFTKFLIWFMAVIPAVVLASCSDDDEAATASEAEIISIRIDDSRVMTQPPVIDGQTDVTFIVSSEATDLVFTPMIEVSEGASISPASGLAQDFSQPVTYKVTSAGGRQTKTYTVTGIRLKDTNARVEHMMIEGGQGCVEDDVKMEGTDIYFYVNYHSTPAQLQSIKLDFLLSSINATIEPVEGREPDFSAVGYAKYKVTAENENVYVVYTVHKVVKPNTDAMITSFVLTGDSNTDPILVSQPELDPGDQSKYSFLVKYRATDSEIDALVPVIEVSEGASYEIKPGSPEYFSQGVITYVVTAENGTDKTEYTARYVRDKNDEARIITVNTEGTIVSNPVVDETAKKVSLYAASTITDAQIKAFRPDFVLSDNATVATLDPAESNFDYLGTGVKYVVTAENGTDKQTYTVIIDREARNSAKITALALTGTQADLLESVNITENEGGTGTIAITLKPTAAKTKIRLSPAITHSAGSTMTPASGAEVEFTYGTAVRYTVTAEDGITIKHYDVTVYKNLNDEALVTSISFSDNGTPEDPNLVDTEFSGAGNKEVTIIIKEDLSAAELAALNLTIATSANATITPGSSNPATLATSEAFGYEFTVTAEDGVATNVYKIRFLKRKVYNFETWTPVNPTAAANMIYDICPPWSNANAGAQFLKILNKYPKNDPFPTIGTDDADDVYSGTYAASLTTRKITKFLSYPELVPGSMFLGSFITNATNPLNSTKFGIEFHGRPIKVKGKYKYAPGTPFYENGNQENNARTDGPAMTAVMFEVDDFSAESVDHTKGATHNPNNYLDGSNLLTSTRILAKVQERNYPATSTFSDFDLVLQYGQNGNVYNPAQNYKFVVVFSSSKDGDIFDGAHLSKLVIDEVYLYYE